MNLKILRLGSSKRKNFWSKKILPQSMFLNNEKIIWTKHSRYKMRQYRLSEKRVLAILRKPDRKEEGIAPGTIAAMQVAGTKRHPTEVWMMYQIVKSPLKIRIISAWRYPGRTPARKQPVIPEDTLAELRALNNPPPPPLSSPPPQHVVAGGRNPHLSPPPPRQSRGGGGKEGVEK